MVCCLCMPAGPCACKGSAWPRWHGNLPILQARTLHRCPASGSAHRAARSMPPPLAATAQVADAAAGNASGSGAAKAPSSNDLLIVGPGVLGSYLGKLWLEQYPDATVVGQTNSDANHDR